MVSPINAAGNCPAYVDIARVGKLLLNGSLFTWAVTGSIEADINSFRCAFEEQLKLLDPEGNMDSHIRSNIVFLSCKALSANYVLADLTSLLKRLLVVQENSFISLSTQSCEGVMVNYFVDVLPGWKRIRAGIRWPWAGNIVELTPDCFHVAQGTLSSLQTEFDCLPDLGYKPVYEIHISHKKSFWKMKANSVHRLTAAEALREPVSLELPKLLPCLLGTKSISSCAFEGGGDMVDRCEGGGCFHRIASGSHLVDRNKGAGCFNRIVGGPLERRHEKLLRKCAAWVQDTAHRRTLLRGVHPN
jgi:hypothetical protein